MNQPLFGIPHDYGNPHMEIRFLLPTFPLKMIYFHSSQKLSRKWTPAITSISPAITSYTKMGKSPKRLTRWFSTWKNQLCLNLQCIPPGLEISVWGTKFCRKHQGKHRNFPWINGLVLWMFPSTNPLSRCFSFVFSYGREKGIYLSMIWQEEYTWAWRAWHLYHAVPCILHRKHNECGSSMNKCKHLAGLLWNEWATFIFSGWWLSHPSEKYESQLGWLETQLIWENKIDGNQTTNQFCFLLPF